jgi:hypothetical protein
MAFLHQSRTVWQNDDDLSSVSEAPQACTNRRRLRSTSLNPEMSPNRQRLSALTAASVTCVALGAVPALAGTYGKLIVRHSAAPATTLETRFSRIPAANSFVLVVTEPAHEPLSFTWSLRCDGANHRESGGASGRATIANGHWVKRISPHWIVHPVTCSGSIAGVAAGTPVLVRVFAA